MTTDYATELAQFASLVQVIEWERLRASIDQAANGAWSIEASNCALIIIEAARLVGPTSHDEVAWPLVPGGVYAALLTAANIEHAMPSDEEAKLTNKLMEGHGLTGHHALRRYAGTVAAIREPRETRWLRREGEGS